MPRQRGRVAEIRVHRQEAEQALGRRPVRSPGAREPPEVRGLRPVPAAERRPLPEAAAAAAGGSMPQTSREREGQAGMRPTNKTLRPQPLRVGLSAETPAMPVTPPGLIKKSGLPVLAAAETRQVEAEPGGTQPLAAEAAAEPAERMALPRVAEETAEMAELNLNLFFEVPVRLLLLALVMILMTGCAAVSWWLVSAGLA